MFWNFQCFFFFFFFSGFFEKHKGTSYLLDVQQKLCKNNFFQPSRTLFEQNILSLFYDKVSRKTKKTFFREAAFQNNFLCLSLFSSLYSYGPSTNLQYIVAPFQVQRTNYIIFTFAEFFTKKTQYIMSKISKIQSKWLDSKLTTTWTKVMKPFISL
jgi:hypothetical protein